MQKIGESYRLVDIILDEPLIRRVAVIENECAQAIFDLLRKNSFIPVDKTLKGPFVFAIKIVENGQAIYATIQDQNYLDLQNFTLSLRPLRVVIKEYFDIYESYFNAIKKPSAMRIQTIDMARRSIHNEGAGLLRLLLKRKVKIDAETARRLFTLISIMHIRG